MEGSSFLKIFALMHILSDYIFMANRCAMARKTVSNSFIKTQDVSLTVKFIKNLFFSQLVLLNLIKVPRSSNQKSVSKHIKIKNWVFMKVTTGNNRQVL